ncbi:Serine/threonine-protein phosphatase 5 [Folsomia candida]|uniref:Serine/threonine-protein phosphatase 5 n=1 Tax=Folsomia candida TaxID=158441 RepID=A0A226DXW3_FOLCA|nr:Serine/threonine-protein phosphatase 5 [Folsomia candida]
MSTNEMNELMRNFPSMRPSTCTINNRAQLNAALAMEKCNIETPVVTKDKIKLCTNKDRHILGQVQYIQQNKTRSPLTQTIVRTATTTLHSLPENYSGNFDLSEANRFLLCRTIAEASKVVPIETVVEDPIGKLGMRLALYNYSVECSGSTTDFQEVLPLGMFLVVRNPWFKSTASGGLALRCDNPAEVDFMSEKELSRRFPDLTWNAPIPFPFQHLVPFWDQYSTDQDRFKNLKTLGNKAFVSKRYTDADRFYSLALEYSKDDEQKVIIFSNRSAVCLAYDCLGQALVWTERGLELDKTNEKCLYRNRRH